MHRILAYVTIAAVSLGFLFYPQANTWYHNRQQITAQLASAQAANRNSGELANDLIMAAHEYNKTLRNSGIEYFPAAAARNDAEYNNQLSVSRNPIMGEVVIPAIDVRLPIYHGTSDNVLQHGAGHVYGTSLPVGGESTHAVISAHAGIPGAAMFRHLDQMVVGDEFFVAVSGQTLRYVVDQITVIEPAELDDVRIVPGEDYVTLLTCTPPGINSHRLLVRGAYAGLGAVAPLTGADVPFPMWAVWYAASLAAAGLLAWAITSKGRKAIPVIADSTPPAIAGSIRNLTTPVVETTPTRRAGRHLAVSTATMVALIGIGLTISSTDGAMAAPSSALLAVGVSSADADQQGTLTVTKHAPDGGKVTDTDFIVRPITAISGQSLDVSSPSGWRTATAFQVENIGRATLGTPQTLSTKKGSATFTLPTGLYYVTETTDAGRIGDPTRRAEAFVVTIPYPNPETGALEYRIIAEPKVDLLTRGNPVIASPRPSPPTVIRTAPQPASATPLLNRTGISLTVLAVATALLATGTGAARRRGKSFSPARNAGTTNQRFTGGMAR